MEKIKEFFKKLLKPQNIIGFLTMGAVTFFVLYYTGVIGGVKEIKQAQKQTDTNINNITTLISSQDKVVERIYTNTIKEVEKKNVEIRKNVAALSDDAVAIELDTLVKQYRLERDGD